MPCRKVCSGLDSMPAAQTKGCPTACFPHCTRCFGFAAAGASAGASGAACGRLPSPSTASGRGKCSRPRPCLLPPAAPVSPLALPLSCWPLLPHVRTAAVCCLPGCCCALLRQPYSCRTHLAVVVLSQMQCLLPSPASSPHFLLLPRCRLGFFRQETAAARAYDCVAAWRNRVLQRQHAAREAKRGNGRRRGQKVRAGWSLVWTGLAFGRAGAVLWHAWGDCLPAYLTSLGAALPPLLCHARSHPPPLLPPPLLSLSSFSRPARTRRMRMAASRSRAA